MVNENSKWVKLYENVFYKDYVNILVKCRYGIYYKLELFGILIVEMMKVGVIFIVRRKKGKLVG